MDVKDKMGEATQAFYDQPTPGRDLCLEFDFVSGSSVFNLISFQTLCK
jgi:hypothetical protein